MASHSESVEMSRAFYADPQNYGPFSLTKDARQIIGCIDPRDPADEIVGEHKIMIQTAGAGAGEALDTALALTVDRSRLVSVEEGLEHDAPARLTTVVDAHHGCKFIGSMAVVLQEMAEPSDFTVESAAQWVRELGIREPYFSNVGKITSAVELQKQHVADQDHMEHLVTRLDTIYPEHANVRSMRGANVSRVYVVNLHPHIGIDRNKKDPLRAESIQGYHDSLAASVVDLGSERGLNPTLRGLRLTALVLRAAAVRTVLTRDIVDEVTFFAVRPAQEGVQIIEEQV